MPRLLFVVDDDSYFCSHRLHLGRAARQAGYEVLVATRVERHGKLIEDEGFKLLPIRLRRGVQSPLQDAASLKELIHIYRRERPDLVHHVALKMVLFGSIAARIVGVPARVNAITGLGHLFHSETRKNRVLRLGVYPLLKWAMKPPGSVVIIQNEEDCKDLVQCGIIMRSQAVIIRGAGVDTIQFCPSQERQGDPVVVLPARILKDKGVSEFVEAARLLKAKGVQAKFALVGGVDPYNPSSFTEAQVGEWVNEGIVEWWGHRDDMLNVYEASHIVVLPSYYEGLPKVLVEAAACSRPLIATRVRGCQNVVRSGDNGLLVPLKDSLALADAILMLIQDRSLRVRMGARGREIVEREFSATRIAAETLEVYRALAPPLSGPHTQKTSLSLSPQ